MLLRTTTKKVVNFLRIKSWLCLHAEGVHSRARYHIKEGGVCGKAEAPLQLFESFRPEMVCSSAFLRTMRVRAGCQVIKLSKVF